jgi:hypothetical protein
MRATLVKKAEGWYNLYQDNIGIGSTHAELQGYKLSKENCDEIFGVVTPEAMMRDIESNCEVTKEGFIVGFQTAMVLIKDKQFTLDDLKMAIKLARETARRDEFLHSENDIIQEISKKPKEVEIEIESVKKQLSPGATSIEDSDWVTFTQIPKLDENGCLILAKAEQ